jgi:6-phosphogluconolactonase
VAVLPIGDDGRLEAASDVRQHHGSGADPERQEGPHAHSVTPDPSNRFALVADLGLDRVVVYRLDLERGALLPHDAGTAVLPPVSGPRHLAFHPSARYVYVINELSSTLTSCAWDEAGGALRPIQSVSTLPVGFSGRSFCADVHVAPSGRFVYGSNRGHDSIAAFAVDPADGTLAALGHTPTQGRTPRNFAIDPSGEYLLAANQDSDSIATFRLDGETGRLTATGHVARIPSPVCVAFANGGQA